MLIHSLWSEGQRIFRTLGPATSYADCVALLAGHFAAPQSVIVRRIVFRQRRQRPGESVHHYAADLRCLASLCKFGRLEEEMIRDKLAEHTIDTKLREKLFMSPDDLSLVKAVELAFQLESAALLTSRLTAPDAAPSHSAQLAQTVTPVPQPRPRSRRARGERCGVTGCHSTSALCPTTIHSVGSCAKPFKWCTVEVDGVCLPLLLDTAASRSLLSESTVRRLFPQQLIKAGAEELYGYGHTRIGMVGTCTFSVRYGYRFLPAFTFQVSRHGANLLGFDLFCALGFSITDNTGTAILTVTTPWQQRWPSLFTGLGCLTAFNHQPLIDSTVSPVIQPLRRLPLSLRDDACHDRAAEAAGRWHHRAGRCFALDL
ncbi:hypothetical protein L3Q82_014649 [Scortum barcoo]|uniref:Uncharacterized protein n=1 Tax=Scortum barcoo TaxID=214431 RepID=A0ACB8VX86_9TELE|nr:hypothetical protein L3Q82_014649 [Scortum barcoo]